VQNADPVAARKCQSLLSGRSRLTLIAAASLGMLGGMLVTWIGPRIVSERRANLPRTLRYFDGHPEQWLLPPGSTVEGFLTDPEARHILDAPDRIVVHPAAPNSDPDPIIVAGYRFGSKGTAADASIEDTLLLATRSISSYAPRSAGVFTPDVLMRCTREGRTLNLLFSFDYLDIDACLDGQGSVEAPMGAGLTPIGAKVFITCFAKVLPEYQRIQKLYQGYARFSDQEPVGKR